MEPPTPFSTESIIKEVNNNKIEIKLCSSGNILSLSTEANNKKYRQVLSINELQKSQIFFKQFSSLNQIITAIKKIIASSNKIEIKNDSIEIKFKNFLEEDISIKLPEETSNIDLIYLNLKELQIENDNLKNLLLKNNTGENSKLDLINKSESYIEDSVILKDKEDIMIKNWISNNKNLSFDLIYKATRDGDDVKDFHKLCDGISPTLTICRTKNGNRFGGYTSVALTKNSSDQAINDPNAFVFSIDKSINIILIIQVMLLEALPVEALALVLTVLFILGINF